MPIDTHPARMRGRTSERTPEQIIAEQKEQAAKNKARADAQKAAAANVPAKTGNAGPAAKLTGAVQAITPEVLAETGKLPTKASGTAMAMPDTRTEVQKYIDEIAPASIVGRMIKFSKDAKFVTADDDEPVDEAAEFIALCDEVLIGWIRFHRDGETPPDRVQGLLHDGFIMPSRATLGDQDKGQWEPGLSGEPEDPWKHQMCLVLQHSVTRELFTFVTTSETGRRSIGNLLRHYDRMRKTNSDEVPVVHLKPSGFNHRDPRVGWVPTPQFAIVGRALRDSAAKPDTSIEADLNDEIPFNEGAPP